jgi:hypothetical protein
LDQIPLSENSTRLAGIFSKLQRQRGDATSALQTGTPRLLLEGYTIIRCGETLENSTLQLSDLHGILVRRVSRRQMHQFIDAGFVHSVRGNLAGNLDYHQAGSVGTLIYTGANVQIRIVSI